MAEFTYNPIQVVSYGQNILLNDSITCKKGYVIHRNGSGLVTLTGKVNNPCCSFARYKVTFNGNIAVPEGGTAGPISIAIAINGEPIQTSKAIVTPTVVDAYFNVTSTAFITLPCGCCETISVENTSDPATPDAAGSQINVQNANLVVTRVS